jgi:phospholipase C
MLPSNLDRIEHVVVLMLENRSFDHMLGYLKLKHGLAIDGLTGCETNPGENGSPVGVHRLKSTRFPTDVGHAFRDVAEQLEGPNQGFVRNYLRHAARAAAPDLVMGYHDESQVWAYDYLARNFAVCDRWFASVPGPAVPNRLFSLAGSSDGDTDHAKGVKIYEGLRTVFDCLDQALGDRAKDERWGYYFHDLPMLVLLEQHLDELSPGSLRKVLAWLTGCTPRIRKIDVFFERARAGRLPAVSWIDPNFADIGQSDDDRPPKSDIHDGQSLVAKVYNAILGGGSDLWTKTLLVVLYDEHGGFFDHVAPPPSGDPSPFDRLGVRVPAIVVSAWTPASVDSVDRDHTSLLRTILDRFAPTDSLTPRVARAPSLAAVLSLASPRGDARPIETPARPTVFAEARAASTAPTGLEVMVRDYREELARRGVSLQQ